MYVSGDNVDKILICNSCTHEHGEEFFYVVLSQFDTLHFEAQLLIWEVTKL